jgi:hypothetical protein
MDRLIEFFDLPEYLRDRWVAVRNFVEKEAAAEITPGVNGPTADESLSDDASNVLPADDEPPADKQTAAANEPAAEKPTAAAAPQADFTPGVKEPTDAAPPADNSGDDPLAIPDHLDRRATRPLRAGSLKGDVT